MPDYDVTIDLSNPNVSHVQVVGLVGDAKRVLDVGCWNGDLGRVLMDGGCQVSGVELDPTAAAIAAGFMDRVEVLDLDRTSLTDHFEPDSFDAIVFADVLEHVHDPVGVLRSAIPLLATGGRVVISVPNVAHGSLRLAHLQGRWDLTDTGLLDRTHIRFFNRERLFDLLEDAGLVAEDLRGTTADPFAVEVKVDNDLPAGVAEWVRDQQDAFIYQFQVAARPRRGDEPVGRRLPLSEGRPADEVRTRDQHTVAAEAAVRDALARRDEFIGLQGQVAAQKDSLTRTRARIESQKTRIADLTTRLEAAERERDELRSRAGARVRRKLGAARRRVTG